MYGNMLTISNIKIIEREYVDNWWNIVNWKNVEERFGKASQLKWKPF